MSDPQELYIASVREAFFAPGSETAFQRLNRAAELWRELDQHFSAGMAMSAAVRAAWGRPELMAKAQNTSLEDFRAAVASNPPTSPAGLASLHKLRAELEQTLWLFQTEKRAVKGQIRLLGDELGQRLLTHFADSDKAENYLVKGVRLSTDLDGTWTVDFPSYEVDRNVGTIGPPVTFGVPSAFHLFVAEEDWQGAHEIVMRYPGAFSSHGLKGWKAVVLANVDKSRAVEFLDEAADAFASDKPPTEEELIARGGAWSGINEQLWAKYFRARARIYEAIRKPTELTGLVQTAVQNLQGTESGWHSGEVSRFRILIGVLAKLVSDPASMDPAEARREYLQELRLSEEDEFDAYALKFITEAAEAFRGFQADPGTELTRDRLSRALDAFGRVPFIGPEVAEAARPAVGESALRSVLGPVRTWMHRSLQAVTDESQLRAILLQLLQGRLPLYAQIRHGSIEYGKDIAELREHDGEVELRFYQVKCGNIKMGSWRECRAQLEEMFLVPISSLQLPAEPTQTIGTLVCNGHANPHVEPVMDGWIREQRQTHNRLIEFWHLDCLVAWITDNRLVNELKEALAEQGVPIRGAD
jgi:tetratricopeptide (TPR) repeat protein